MAKAKLTKSYGLTHALTLGIGTMIGAGIFILPSLAAGRAGPAASISYLIGGIIAILTALSISELATGMSKAGGSYYYINHSLGPFWGTITGIGMWMGLIFASAFYMIGFELYLTYFFEEIDLVYFTLDTRLISFFMTVGLIAMNYCGTKGAGDFQKIIVILLMVILIGFIVAGSFHVDRGNLEPIAPEGWGSVVGVAGLVFIGFLGFEVVATVAEEVKEPEKTLWKAMIGSVVIVTIMYMAIMVIATGIVPYEELADEDTPIAYTAEQFLGSPGAIIITFAALLATISSANASILSASRINLAMSKDRILHPWSNKLHKKFNTPSNAILLTGVLILIIFAIHEVEMLAEVAGFMFLMTFTLVHACVYVLRKTQPKWYNPTFRSPLFPYTQILGGALCIGLMGYMVYMSPISMLVGLVMIGIALVWYKVWSSRKSKVTGEVKKVFQEISIEEAKKVIQDTEVTRGTILVPFSNTFYDPLKARLAGHLATEKGRLIRLNVVEIPDQTPIESAMDHIDIENVTIKESTKKDDEVIPVEKKYIQKISHSIPQSIVNVSRQEGCELIFLGGYKKKLPTARIKQTITNFILHKAIKDTAVFSVNEESGERLKKNPTPEIKKIMVPFDDNRHTVLALKIAKQIAQGEKATITLFNVSYKKDLNETEEKIKKVMADYTSDRVKIETVIVTGLSPGKEIIAASQGYDLMVMGASRMWVVNKFLFGTIPDRVMSGSSCPVIIVKKWEPTTLSQMKGRLLK